jgi:sirohydrochlorin ferrochelatase
VKALLLVAHGSRRESSNQEIRDLTARLAARAGDRFGHVGHAFLEIAQPSIPDGIQDCIDRGAADVVVLPYFLSAGRHVAEDIPNDVAVKQAEYPDLRIRIAPYLGAADEVVDLLIAAATTQAGAP